MSRIFNYIDDIDWPLIILMSATLGLAPFAPPHLFQKISMLISGTLLRPLDWFDLFLHGAPWILLMIKSILAIRTKAGA